MSGLHPNQTTQVPPPAIYRLPKVSSIVSRKTTKINPSNGTSFVGGNQITIEIPSISYLDGSNSYLSLVTKVTNSASGSVPTFDDNSACFIDRLRISTGRNEVLVDIQNYNILNGIMEDCFSSKEYRNSAGSILDGIGASSAEEEVKMASGTRRCLSLIGGILNNDNYYPLRYTSGIIIDIFLASADVCSSCTTGTNVLTVSDVSFVAEIVELDDQYTRAFENAYLTSGIKYSVNTFIGSTTSLTSNHEQKQINENLRSLKTIWCVQKQNTSAANDVNDKTDNAGTTVWRNCGTESVQFRWGNELLPTNPIDCKDGAAQAYKELTKAMNLSSSVRHGSIINMFNYSNILGDDHGTKFIVALNTEKDPSHAMSGIDSNKKSLSVTFVHSGAQAPATINSTLYTFAEFDQLVIIAPSGVQIIY